LARRLVRFLLATGVQGILFLVPIALVAVVAREAFQLLRRGLEPVARLLPQNQAIGLVMEDLLALVAITIVFLIAGLFVGTRPGRLLSQRLEQSVLYRVPGYLLVRGAMGSFPGLDTESPPEPALVRIDDGWLLGLVVERWPEGFFTVYLPSAPTPTSGSVMIVEADRVQPLAVSTLAFLGCLTRSGAGARGLLAGQIPRADCQDPTQPPPPT
jgi:uncharacterized membrane protein